MRRIPNRPRVPQRRPGRVVERLAIAFVEEVAAMGGLHEVLFHTDFARRRPVAEKDDPVRRLERILRAGREAGAFADLDAGPTARLIFAVIHETADAVEAGEDRERALNVLLDVVARLAAG